MKIFSLIIFFACLTLKISAQINIEEIKAHYYEVADLIKKCPDKASIDCNLYIDEIQLNKRRSNWGGVGNYNKKINFWYNDDPGHCDGCEVNPLMPLLKIEVTEIVSAFEYYEEFLLLDGKLVFYFKKSDDEDGNIEQRYYIAGNKIIKYLCNNDSYKNKLEIEKILQKAKKIQNAFLNYH